MCLARLTVAGISPLCWGQPQVQLKSSSCPLNNDATVVSGDILFGNIIWFTAGASIALSRTIEASIQGGGFSQI